MRRVKVGGFVALVVLVVLVLAAGVAYALDARGHDGEVARNVSLAGRGIGGLTRAEVQAVVDRLAEQAPDTPVRVRAGDGGFRTDARTLGVTVDRQRTVDAALAAGRGGALPGRVWSWLTSFATDRDAPVRVTVDPKAVREAVARLDRGDHKAPVEPTIRARESGFEAVAGRDGEGIDPGDVVEALPDAIAHQDRDGIDVEIERGAVPPRFTKADAERLATRAEELTRSSLAVQAGGQTATVKASMLRSWLTARAGDESLELAVDRDEASGDLHTLLPRAGTPAVDAGFTVAGGAVRITPAKDGTSCCDPAAADEILRALQARPAGPVQLPLQRLAPKRTVEDARKLGINELVSTFTTPHKCCEPRVTNIQRIAELLRGVVIEPGGVFSVNQTIGKRTVEKGFVSAPVIENGQHSEDVGGGISQMATTLFNAAWFAGLDFGEYQSHSLYISRYPYGREATMGYPHPDLVIKNNTPYGVLLWPTDTGTSTTVNVYSTKAFASVTMSNQTKAAQGTCTVVTSERTRVKPDGTRSVDVTRARYRAEEGLNCDGSRAPAPKEG